MSTEQNKAVVRRFMKETLAGGNVDVIDELLAPNYVNRAMAGMGLAGFKGALAGMAAAIAGREFEIEDLVAEGDAVVARFTWAYTFRQWGEDRRPGSHLLRARQRQDHRRRPDHHAGPDADAWPPARAS
jgi:predicted SnoaL-like aldol condensation-catalyzing enzyme